MKKQFSKHWNSSSQPRKQRKYLAEAPLHIRGNFVSSNLSKELRKKYQRRSFPLRKGDNVKIMVGAFKKKTGKIGNVDLLRSRVTIEGIQKKKKDGTKVNVFFNPSNLQIQELNLEDRKRVKAIERKIKELFKKDLGEKNTKPIKKEENTKEKIKSEDKKSDNK